MRLKTQCNLFSTLLLVICFHFMYGQKDSATPVNHKPRTSFATADQNFSIALRGKVFGFFIIEDTFFSTATLGIEFLMKGRHSLGIDATFFGWQYERDDKDDNPLYETYERRTYLYLDYKYRAFRFKTIDLYVNLYDKAGTYHMWHEGVAEGYNFWDKPFLTAKTDGIYTEVGAGLGIKKYFNDRFYLDVSVNGGRAFSINDLTTYDDSLQVTNQEYNVKSDRNIFYIRVNLAYKIFIKHTDTVYTD